MSFLAGSIIGTLGLETGGFTQGFLGVTSLTQTFPSFITNFMASPILGLVGLVKDAFSTITSVIEDAFTSAQESADKLHDMAINVGVSAQALSGLGLAAQQAGSSTEGIADAFKFLGKNVAAAMQGTKDTVANFQQIGVAFQDASGQARPLQEILFDVADAIAALPPGAARTDVALSLLGRSGTELIATLSQGSEAIKEQIRTFEQYGAVISDQAAESADAFGDLWGEIKIAWTGIKNLIGEPLRESLTPVLQELVQWIRDHMPEIREWINEIVSLIKNAASAVISVIENLKTVSTGAGIGALIGGILGGPAGAVGGALLGGGITAAGIAITRPTQISIQTPAIDARDASSQIAAKLTPAVQESYTRMRSDLDLAAQRAAIEAGF